jgi:hypothetical protein
MMAYVFSGLVIAGVILYVALCIGGLIWGVDNDHPFIGCIPCALLVFLMLFCMFMAIAQAFTEAGVGA